MILGRDLANSYYEEDEKLFSTGDEELDDILEEVYYSGISDGYDYAQKEFASTVWDIDEDDEDEDESEKRKERAKKREGKHLGDSHRGLGRSVILGGLGGTLGAYTTKEDAEADYKKGYSEGEIVRRASKRGGKRGAILGAGIGAASGLASAAITKNPSGLLYIPANAAFGYLGGSLGAKKNAKTRLADKRDREED